MSIDAMTTQALSYRSRPVRTSSLLRGTIPTAPDGATNQSTGGAALSAIVAYIPTEIVTTYVAVLAALAGSTSQSRTGQWATLFVFLALTPITTWVVYAVKYKAKNKALPTHLNLWPWWEMVAASLAFIVWSYALPGTPFARLSWYQAGLGSAALLLVSFLLGLVAPIFQPAQADG